MSKNNVTVQQTKSEEFKRILQETYGAMWAGSFVSTLRISSRDLDMSYFARKCKIIIEEHKGKDFSIEEIKEHLITYVTELTWMAYGVPKRTQWNGLWHKTVHSSKHAKRYAKIELLKLLYNQENIPADLREAILTDNVDLDSIENLKKCANSFLTEKMESDWLVLGDIELRSLPRALLFNPHSRGVDVVANLAWEGDTEGEWIEPNQVIFLGDIAKGHLSTTHIRMICQLIEAGRLPPEKVVMGNRDFNMVYAGRLLEDTSQYTTKAQALLLELFNDNEPTLTYKQLKERYCEKGNELWIDLDQKSKGKAVKSLLIAYLYKEKTGEEITNDKNFTKEEIKQLFSSYNELAPEKQEQILLRFLHNECFGCPDGYEKFMLNEAVEYFHEEFNKILRQLPTDKKHMKRVAATQACLNDLYAILEGRQSDETKWETIIDRVNQFVKNSGLPKNKFPKECRKLNSKELYTDLTSPMGTILHARVKDLLVGLTKADHELGKHFQHTVVGQRTGTLSEKSKVPVCVSHCCGKDDKTEGQTLAKVLKDPHLFDETLKNYQPREGSFAQNSYVLRFAGGRKGQTIHFQGHKPVPATLMTADGEIFTDLSLPFNPNDPVKQAVRIKEDVEGNVFIIIPSQKIATSSASYYSITGEKISQSGNIETMRTVYDPVKHRFLEGLPHFSVPFTYLRNTTNQCPDILKILDNQEEMKREQAIIAGWRRGPDGYIATIHVLGGKKQGQAFKTTVIDIRLTDLLKQLSGLENIPALRNSLVMQAENLTDEELFEVLQATSSSEEKIRLINDMFDSAHDLEKTKDKIILSVRKHKASFHIEDNSDFTGYSLAELKETASFLDLLMQPALKDTKLERVEKTYSDIHRELSHYLKSNLAHAKEVIEGYKRDKFRTLVNCVGYIHGSSQLKTRELNLLLEELENLDDKSCSQLCDLYLRTLKTATLQRTSFEGIRLQYSTSTKLARLLTASIPLFQNKNDGCTTGAHDGIPEQHLASSIKI